MIFRKNILDFWISLARTSAEVITNIYPREQFVVRIKNEIRYEVDTVVSDIGSLKATSI